MVPQIDGESTERVVSFGRDQRLMPEEAKEFI
jgi:hypothetical protein